MDKLITLLKYIILDISEPAGYLPSELPQGLYFCCFGIFSEGIVPSPQKMLNSKKISCSSSSCSMLPCSSNSPSFPESRGPAPMSAWYCLKHGDPPYGHTPFSSKISLCSSPSAFSSPQPFLHSGGSRSALWPAFPAVSFLSSSSLQQEEASASWTIS